MSDKMHRQPCKCNCGYTCGQQCGLGIIECMNVHYKHDCEHQWDGPDVEFMGGQSVTCSKCGMSAISHDMRVGP